MFDSQKKRPSRNSILKNSDRNGLSTNKKQPSTAGVTVKFREVQDIQSQFTKQFKEISTHKKTNDFQHIHQEENNIQTQSYDKWHFIKDVNYLNNIHNHVLTMLSSNFSQGISNKKSAKQEQLIASIKKEIQENIQIKVQLDKKSHKINNIYQISHYLKVSSMQFIQNQSQSFFVNFKSREQQLKSLEIHLNQLKNNKNINKYPHQNDKSIRQKQQRCKTYARRLQKQKMKIKMLEQQQRKLFKKLYKTQKDILHNQRSNTNLQLKINQIEGEEEYRLIRSKSKIGNHSHCKNKQNMQMVENKEKGKTILGKKNVKIQSNQVLKGGHSLNKLIKKRML